MWASAPLPIYSTTHNFKKAARRATVDNDSSKQDVSSSTSRPSTRSRPDPQSSKDIMFEPAVDGPPSPERIRAFSKHVKRVSALESTSSVAARPPTTDRPSWENTLEHITLSRRSSGRSTSSSMPSRERPESVQLFGKTIFNRKVRMRAESNANSSSGSSLYSTDQPLDSNPIPPPKEQLIPGLFGRRKIPKTDPTSADRPASSSGNKKLLISGPYNFQHVTHTRREHVPQAQRESRADFSAARPPRPPPAAPLLGIEGDSLHFSNFSSEALAIREDAVPAPSTTSAKHGLTTPPYEAAPEDTIPPIPPPRISSRTSTRYDATDSLIAGSWDRTLTGGGFRQPKPFPLPAESDTLPTTAGELLAARSAELESPSSPTFPHAITTPDDAAWPLTTSSTTFAYETGLADVPEEDEQHVASRRSRLSLASNNSSLRGSHSVPMLRLSAQLQAAQLQSKDPHRPMSGASDTLGRFDMIAAQRALKAALHETNEVEILPRESWEDDIDYCYDHEAEADFEYAWDRPSLDGDRAEEDHSVDLDATATTASYSFCVDEDIEGVQPLSVGLQPVPARHFDIPALSPVSQASTATGHEAITPTVPLMPTTFKESHGFNLSPSLLIPGDFQQQMVMAESRVDEYSDEMLSGAARFSYGTDAPVALSTSGLDERHISADSNLTALTRYTSGTAFEAWNPKALDTVDPASLEYDEVPPLASPKSPKSPWSDGGDVMSRSMGDIRDEERRIAASAGRESVQSTRNKETYRHRRQRAHTTSLSTPAGGYALFPPAYAGNRI
ncbi:uncharacterized protein VDAG_06327 [Verticillium dahliae VdLs.17]|uniref:CRIB domain-containing protein n=1 Tax=Verticillium dahliae (strain VdLs.17 / ATCC MYA-4575 / FGSC 10137) TaxID=498257 RepID=G2X769_VERDV|nr:uncharacterized protein VDAG_06327 [Verticillium dahliae VdLs.17]EGY14837.1 hypothetical protein VDAG_06327 [Verticillium dahliae VdLs.17]KAH6694725.1 hypothetical protein EV126DRAFT_345913 [Verticillium dahliae]